MFSFFFRPGMNPPSSQLVMTSPAIREIECEFRVGDITLLTRVVRLSYITILFVPGGRRD